MKNATKNRLWYMALGLAGVILLWFGYTAWLMIVTPKVMIRITAELDREKIPFDDTWTVRTEDETISTAEIEEITVKKKQKYMLDMTVYRAEPNGVILTDPEGNEYRIVIEYDETYGILIEYEDGTTNETEGISAPGISFFRV